MSEIVRAAFGHFRRRRETAPDYFAALLSAEPYTSPEVLLRML